MCLKRVGSKYRNHPRVNRGLKARTTKKSARSLIGLLVNTPGVSICGPFSCDFIDRRPLRYDIFVWNRTIVGRNSLRLQIRIAFYSIESSAVERHVESFRLDHVSYVVKNFMVLYIMSGIRKGGAKLGNKFWENWVKSNFFIMSLKL